jgi:ABC-type sugar transport system ATPase subunit
VKVIRNVDIEARDCEFVVVVGPSGCGKSTLLRMIAGLQEVTSGWIMIGDRLVTILIRKIATSRGCSRTMPCIRT